MSRKVSRSDIALKIICGHEILTATHKLQLHPTAFYSAISEVGHRPSTFVIDAGIASVMLNSATFPSTMLTSSLIRTAIFSFASLPSVTWTDVSCICDLCDLFVGELDIAQFRFDVNVPIPEMRPVFHGQIAGNGLVSISAPQVGQRRQKNSRQVRSGSALLIHQRITLFAASDRLRP